MAAAAAPKREPGGHPVSNELAGKRIAFLVANSGVEQVELTRPWQAVQDAGGEPVLIAPEADKVQAVHHDLELGDIFCRPTSAMPAATGATRKCSCAGGRALTSSLAVSPTIWTHSASSSSRSSRTRSAEKPHLGRS
jgi:hypothetical protein